jgi:CheY-like chemotaxis protein
MFFGLLPASSLLASENKGIGSQATWASVLHSHWKQADHFVASKTTGGERMQSVRKRILCVEDDEDSSGLMTALFELLNYQVVIASTSAEGLRMSQNERFDLYLLDSRLPDGTGSELCKQIRSFDWVTPILFLSADVYPQTQAEAFSAGAQAYLTKPVDPDVLKEMVRWLLDERTAGASR